MVISCAIAFTGVVFLIKIESYKTTRDGWLKDFYDNYQLLKPGAVPSEAWEIHRRVDKAMHLLSAVSDPEFGFPSNDDSEDTAPTRLCFFLSVVFLIKIESYKTVKERTRDGWLKGFYDDYQLLKPGAVPSEAWEILNSASKVMHPLSAVSDPKFGFPRKGDYAEAQQDQEASNVLVGGSVTITNPNNR
ncbi:hypothetical protein PHYSODRAFT_328501 [Phytophthora sojae]|uniref:Uncharacterized protein n=1 Tax=Phytophthora sojae (strain P6497) TaxID=1094619 RepID=G4Z7I0_PHYSP|nr:hypothetical protein PHYSODRAFT_328501 [Phytophthora sojae]EGZ20383.1 hypothetical protein PHYSODRAFT_328501 [Phytophthora sojae]|eukprot:XP_009523100.1 hypothetical protein PHYSODRAFT_328501 [Phytophthora sojae]